MSALIPLVKPVAEATLKLGTEFKMYYNEDGKPAKYPGREGTVVEYDAGDLKYLDQYTDPQKIYVWASESGDEFEWFIEILAEGTGSDVVTFEDLIEKFPGSLSEEQHDFLKAGIESIRLRASAASVDWNSSSLGC